MTPPRRRKASSPNPMEEENFPTSSPTRRAVEREMDEPSNLRGPSDPVGDEDHPPVYEGDKAREKPRPSREDE